MAREAKRRRFDEVPGPSFSGRWPPWNWSIWKTHFRKYAPILDFIHPLSYLFAAAKAVHRQAPDAWDQYLAWMRGCWQGDVEQVLEELRRWRSKLGEPEPTTPEGDPRQIIARTVGYLENNRTRMNYPEYRRQGLPVTTACMKSLIKEINYRAKGTEMFWAFPFFKLATGCLGQSAACPRPNSHWGFAEARPRHPKYFTNLKKGKALTCTLLARKRQAFARFGDTGLRRVM